MVYKPSNYLVRLSTIKNGDAFGSVTMENQDPAVSKKVKLAAVDLATQVLGNHLQVQPSHEVEILLGATANRLSHLEGLVNNCRNLLVDLEGASMTSDVRQVYDAIMRDLDEEVGLG